MTKIVHNVDLGNAPLTLNKVVDTYCISLEEKSHGQVIFQNEGGEFFYLRDGVMVDEEHLHHVKLFPPNSKFTVEV